MCVDMCIDMRSYQTGPAHTSTRISMRMPIHMSIRMHAYMPKHMSIHMHTHMPAHMPIHILCNGSLV